MIIRPTLPETPNYTTPRGTIVAAVVRPQFGQKPQRTFGKIAIL